jgi:hypothetical protein
MDIDDSLIGGRHDDGTPASLDEYNAHWRTMMEELGLPPLPEMTSEEYSEAQQDNALSSEPLPTGTPRRRPTRSPKLPAPVAAEDPDLESTIDPEHDPDAVIQTPEQIKHNKLRWAAILDAATPEVRAFFEPPEK